MQYVNFNNYGKTFIGNQNRTEIDRLPPGIYELQYDGQRDMVFFNNIQTNYDQLLDLPSKEFDHVLKELSLFLQPETKKAFKDYGFLYKRSTLLFGIPGTGKTCLVNRIAEEVVKNKGVVIFNPNPQVLVKAFKVLTDIQPDVKTMVIFEELDQLSKRYEDDLLHILDGEIQKENVVYMATTNFLDKVPRRLCRPGRFSSIIEVEFPDAAAREFYLRHKLLEEDQNEVPGWVAKTEGLSIDELKETVLAVKCLGQNLEDVVVRLKAVEDRKNIKDKTNYEDAEEQLEYDQYRDDGPFEKLVKAEVSRG
jgi:SpoVK/Ycf46/Vps4 family AAA+-type ATPase